MIRKLSSLLLVVSFLTCITFAQSPTAVQQAASRLDAAGVYSVPAPATACATVNTTTANGTVTVPAVGGLSFYVTGFYMDITSNVTGTTEVAVYTTAGLNQNISYSAASIATATATTGLFRQIAEVYNPPLKGTPNTAVTFTPSAQQANTIFCPRVTGYYAP